MFPVRNRLFLIVAKNQKNLHGQEHEDVVEQSLKSIEEKYSDTPRPLDSIPHQSEAVKASRRYGGATLKHDEHSMFALGYHS